MALLSVAPVALGQGTGNPGAGGSEPRRDRPDPPGEPKVERQQEPEVERPRVEQAEEPEVERPERPREPKVERPKARTPDRAERPRADRPRAPRADRPETPRADRPRTPRADRPRTPRADRPRTPRADGPGPRARTGRGPRGPTGRGRRGPTAGARRVPTAPGFRASDRRRPAPLRASAALSRGRRAGDAPGRRLQWPGADRPDSRRRARRASGGLVRRSRFLRRRGARRRPRRAAASPDDRFRAMSVRARRAAARRAAEPVPAREITVRRLRAELRARARLLRAPPRPPAPRALPARGSRAPSPVARRGGAPPACSRGGRPAHRARRHPPSAACWPATAAAARPCSASSPRVGRGGPVGRARRESGPGAPPRRPVTRPGTASPGHRRAPLRLRPRRGRPAGRLAATRSAGDLPTGPLGPLAGGRDGFSRPVASAVGPVRRDRLRPARPPRRRGHARARGPPRARARRLAAGPPTAPGSARGAPKPAASARPGVIRTRRRRGPS